MPNTLKINTMKGIECVLYHLTDARLTPKLADYYKKHLKEKFVFSAGELKRTQFCLDLAKSVIGEERDCTVADIGPGRRLFSAMMCEEGYREVTAIDMRYYEGCEIENNNFTFLNSTIENIEASYDYTFCFEVLEHNPLASLEANIAKIKSITNKKAVISLPYYEDPVTTKGHCFTLDTEIIHQYFQGSKIYLLYREVGFSYIFFVFDCERTL